METQEVAKTATMKSISPIPTPHPPPIADFLQHFQAVAAAAALMHAMGS